MTTPFVSIIVPTFDRQKALTACVQAMRRLDYPRDRFEVIIVDDGSSVPVMTPGRDRQDDVMITVLRQLNAGPASARNMGAQYARGEILAFTDDDCTPAPQWLSELAKSFNDIPTALVGGRTVNNLINNPYSSTSQMIVNEASLYFLSRNSDLRFFASNNMSVSAKLFQESGGFDPSFRTSEDRDFCDRWIRRGHPLVYSSEAIVYHHHHLTLTTFCRQHFNFGRGAHRLHRARAQRGRSRLTPTLQFYASVFRSSLFTTVSWKLLRTAGLMGVWQAANLAGFLWQGFCQAFPLFRCTHDQGLSHTAPARCADEEREERNV